MPDIAHSNRRPDEEGIKTLLREPRFQSREYSNRRPDEEGIKTSGCPTLRTPCIIPTADLMKKGLRRHTVAHVDGPIDSNRRPDEEGIKTIGKILNRGNVADSNRRPDEEGIKTPLGSQI